MVSGKKAGVQEAPGSAVAPHFPAESASPKLPGWRRWSPLWGDHSPRARGGGHAQTGKQAGPYLGPAGTTAPARKRKRRGCCRLPAAPARAPLSALIPRLRLLCLGRGGELRRRPLQRRPGLRCPPARFLALHRVDEALSLSGREEGLSFRCAASRPTETSSWCRSHVSKRPEAMAAAPASRQLQGL